MNLSVSLYPSPSRIIKHYQLYYPSSRRYEYYVEKKRLENNQFTVMSFDDVRLWANLNSGVINQNHGPYFYYLTIGSGLPDGGPGMNWSMPRGDMILEDRLWIPIEMYEAFYVEVA